MNEITNIHELEGKDKKTYLVKLDNSLHSLEINLATETDFKQAHAVIDFGNSQEWTWDRLPEQNTVYTSLSGLIHQIREMYSWFDWQIGQNPLKNKGYFEKLQVSAESGLPLCFQLMNLHRLKRDAVDELSKLPDYSLLARDLRTVLMNDTTELEKVVERANKIHKTAMKRNFLESLQNESLLGWDTTKYSLKPQAKKLKEMGGEQLWNLTFMRYSLASSQFQIYDIEVWQDIREKHITEEKDGVHISDKLLNGFNFSEENTAWFILKEFDERFESLHPVQVSRALVGPFECKYLTQPDEIAHLEITDKLLAEDSDMALLRFSRQFALAPNHVVNGKGELRQVTYREDWRDEIIVCSSRHSSQVANSVLGTNIR
ncbi:MAG: hypothetical protein Q7R33_06625, partial [Nitrosarchaeum sp.]|nr:hypothetical protein [Nitrosarchaeum sp.]